jgi:hypothetical protein
MKEGIEREIADQFSLRFRLPRKSQVSFTFRKSATWDRRLYFPSEGRHVVDFYRPKNPTASAGFEPAILCTGGQHANHRSRSAKRLLVEYSLILSRKNKKFIGFIGVGREESYANLIDFFPHPQWMFNFESF